MPTLRLAREPLKMKPVKCLVVKPGAMGLANPGIRESRLEVKVHTSAEFDQTGILAVLTVMSGLELSHD